MTLTANGTPVTVSLLATAENGFSSSVQVTIAGLPAGVAAQPSTLTLTPGTAATLSLTAPTGTAAASATATLTATSGALTHTASLPITVVGSRTIARLFPGHHAAVAEPDSGRDRAAGPARGHCAERFHG